MTKRQVIILTIFSAVLILSNIYSGYINVLSDGLFKSYLFQTEKAEFEFLTMPSKGRDVEMMELQFIDFKEKNSEYSNLHLYRTFKRNPLKFWNWYNYLTHERYAFEYQKKIMQAFEEPFDIDQVESAIIETGPNFQETDLNDPRRSIPFERLELIINEMNISKEIGLTKFLPKFKLTFTLKSGETRTFRMTQNTFKERDDFTYEFRTENFADSIWQVAYKQ
jgi:hypothetical protein